jgi:hypothetical protein
MLGNWKNKCSEKLDKNVGGKFPQLLTGGILRRRKIIPDMSICLRNL